MLSSTEQRYCPSCQRETNHVVGLVDKSFGKQPTPEQKPSHQRLHYRLGANWIALNDMPSVKIAEITVIDES
ncbi:hypothetical protein ACTG25_09070 [Aeromonas sp. 80P]